MRKLVFLIISTLLVCAHSQASIESMWLDRMSQAITARDYQGTYVVRENNQLFTYFLQHSNKNSLNLSRVVQLDQDGIEIYSDNETISQITPDHANSSKVIKSSPFSIFANTTSAELNSSYSVKMQPKERICGGDAVVLKLFSDKYRYRYKVWIEKQSALPLKIALMDEFNEIVKEFRFVDIDIAQFNEHIEIPRIEAKDKHSISHHKKALISEETSTKEIPDSPVTWKPVNFKLISSGFIQSNQEDYYNYSYSDGLNSFSILVSDLPIKKKNNDHKSSTSLGATNIIITNKDQKLISILGEVPIQTLEKIANSAQFKNESNAVLP